MEECHYCEGTDDEEEVYREIIECITGALDAKDAYTAGHSQRVSEMALKVCELIGLKKKGIRKIHIAAHLHDIGKIGIPDAILNKEGRLTDEEFEIMKTHSAIGARHFYRFFSGDSCGEVPKWLKGLPWKGSRPLIAVRGFKSHLLRQISTSKKYFKKYLTSIK